MCYFVIEGGRETKSEENLDDDDQVETEQSDNGKTNNYLSQSLNT